MTATAVALDVTMLEIPLSTEYKNRSLVVDNRLAFQRRVIDLVAGGRRDFVLDCTNASYIDSKGLGVLVSIAKHIREAGGTFVVVGANEDLTFLFEQTKLDTIFKVCSLAEWIRDGGTR